MCGSGSKRNLMDGWMDGRMIIKQSANTRRVWQLKGRGGGGGDEKSRRASKATDAKPESMCPLSLIEAPSACVRNGGRSRQAAPPQKGKNQMCEVAIDNRLVACPPRGNHSFHRLFSLPPMAVLEKQAPISLACGRTTHRVSIPLTPRPRNKHIATPHPSHHREK